MGLKVELVKFIEGIISIFMGLNVELVKFIEGIFSISKSGVGKKL
jgi:hypothetical protein